jgi:oxalate decarboxylase/phosphoglucose isomerase-like protein (cupin superfamily)
MYRVYYTAYGFSDFSLGAQLVRYRHCTIMTVASGQEIRKAYGGYEDMHYVLIATAQNRGN